MNDGAFGRRTAPILVGLLGASLVTGLAALVLGDDTREVASSGADTFSASALGHGALAELLEALGHDVRIARRLTAAAPAPDQLTVLAEPGTDADALHRLERAFCRAPRALLVLPKRGGFAAEDDDAWIARSVLLPTSAPSAVLAAAGLDGSVVRPGATADWSTALGIAPELDDPQLVAVEGLEPWIACDAGVLVGRLPGAGERGPAWVLSDPDLLATHGLVRGRNAELAVALIEEAAEGRAVAFDETVHGFGLSVNPWAELRRFPLALATCHAVLVAAVLLAALAGRTGPPRASAPPLAPGKRALVDNTAELLWVGGHHARALRRYVAQEVRALARAFHTPVDRDVWKTAGQLETIAARPDAATSLARVREAVAAAQGPGAADAETCLAAAREVHRWRRERMDGRH